MTHPGTGLYPEASSYNPSYQQPPYQQPTSYSSHRITSSHNTACLQKTIGMVVGLALTAIAIFATIYCMYHGFNMLDFATSSFMEFAGGALIYMGLVSSVVVLGNVLYTGYKTFIDDSYKPEEILTQVGVSIFAPVIAIPLALYFGVQVALSR